MDSRSVTVALGALYVGLAVLANWLAATYLVTVPLTPYVAPAGVFAIGGILVLRDWLQQLCGLWRTMVLVYAAGVLSYLVATLAGWTDLQKVALASVVAFTASETVEAAVFTPIRKRSLAFGVALSGSVGVVLDSVVFLALAFGSLAFLRGQVIGKAEVLACGVVATLARRRVAPVLPR